MSVGSAAARRVGGGSDDGDETRADPAGQPLHQHGARRRQPDDLASPKFTVRREVSSFRQEPGQSVKYKSTD